MLVYRVDFLIDRNKTETAGKLPTYVVADSFDSAVKTARKFERDGVTLYDCAAQLSGGYIAVARGFKGLGVSSEETPVVTN